MCKSVKRMFKNKWNLVFLMEKRSLSIRFIGIVLVLGTLVFNIIKNAEWIISFNAYYGGKLAIEEVERNYDITTNYLFFLLNLIVVCLLVAHFALNLKFKESLKISKIGFYSSIISLLIQLSNIILYGGFIAKDPYAIFIHPELLISQFILGMLYVVGYIIPLVCVWKIVFDSFDKKILKLFSFAIILYGLFTLIIAFQSAYYLFFAFSPPPSIALVLTFRFFIYIMTQLFDAMAIFAGLMLIIKNKD